MIWDFFLCVSYEVSEHTHWNTKQSLFIFSLSFSGLYIGRNWRVHLADQWPPPPPPLSTTTPRPKPRPAAEAPELSTVQRRGKQFLVVTTPKRLGGGGGYRRKATDWHQAAVFDTFLSSVNESCSSVQLSSGSAPFFFSLALNTRFCETVAHSGLIVPSCHRQLPPYTHTGIAQTDSFCWLVGSSQVVLKRRRQKCRRQWRGPVTTSAHKAAFLHTTAWIAVIS